MPEESKFSGALAKLKRVLPRHRPRRSLTGRLVRRPRREGKGGPPASAAIPTISPRPSCYGNRPRKRPAAFWKMPTRGKTSRNSSSSFWPSGYGSNRKFIRAKIRTYENMLCCSLDSRQVESLRRTARNQDSYGHRSCPISGRSAPASRHDLPRTPPSDAPHASLLPSDRGAESVWGMVSGAGMGEGRAAVPKKDRPARH